MDEEYARHMFIEIYKQARQKETPGQEHDQDYDHDDDHIDDDGHQSTFDEKESSRLSGTTRASAPYPKGTGTKGRGKTGAKGIHRRPSVQEREGQTSIVSNLYHTTIHNFSSQAPPMPLIPTFTENLTATMGSGTKLTPRPQHSVS
eukprot:5738703-Amphidinium_carterae.2